MGVPMAVSTAAGMLGSAAAASVSFAGGGCIMRPAIERESSY